MSADIKNLVQLVKPALKPGQTLQSYKCERLLANGENYGSIMLKVQLQILSESGEEETMSCVAKTCPPKGYVWEIFETELTFKIEIALYKVIVPTLNEFGKEKGVECLLNFLGKCLGTRVSLNPESNAVDEDAVILLENLQIGGYKNGDRFIGFDKDTTKLLLGDLALFHAAPIAYREAKPEEFKQKILSHLTRVFKIRAPDKVINDIIDFTCNGLRTKKPKCIPHLTKIKEAMLQMTSSNLRSKKLYTTITHNDFWVNNTMVKYENGKPIGNRMVDFQGIDYQSLANDVVFFLYSSVELPVLKQNADEFYKYYYDSFIKTLVKLKCDTSAYTFDGMMEEIGLIAKEVQFAHLIFLLIPILTHKGDAVDLNELNENASFIRNVHEIFWDRLEFIVLDFNQRGWI